MCVECRCHKFDHPPTGLTIAEHMVNTILSTHIAITYNTTTPPHLEHCRLSNASICRSSVIATRFCMPVYIAVYNPLAHTRVHTPLMLPVAVGGCNYTLLGMGWVGGVLLVYVVHGCFCTTQQCTQRIHTMHCKDIFTSFKRILYTPNTHPPHTQMSTTHP